MSPVGKHEFVIGVPDESSQIKEVTGAVSVDSLLVEYVDHEGKKKTSLVFVPKGSDVAFLLQQKINGVNVATSANSWFNQSLSRYLKTHNPDQQARGEGVEQV